VQGPSGLCLQRAALPSQSCLLVPLWQPRNCLHTPLRATDCLSESLARRTVPHVAVHFVLARLDRPDRSRSSERVLFSSFGATSQRSHLSASLPVPVAFTCERPPSRLKPGRILTVCLFACLGTRPVYFSAKYHEKYQLDPTASITGPQPLSVGFIIVYLLPPSPLNLLQSCPFGYYLDSPSCPEQP